ncbi:MAG: transcriptional repressor LexA [Treponema sp.]|jgi:repressor LexA|nr:transcriptional repressor LexA [Treponema sp.]
MRELTARQKEVLSFIDLFSREHSYPPTIREIGDHFGISVKGAHDHVIALKKKGFLRQEEKRSRTMEVVGARSKSHYVEIPLVGVVAAGTPIMSEENFEGTIPIHDSLIKKNRKYFALKVRGDSMSGAGILDGDTAVIEKTSVVRNGEIAVTWVNNAATLKRVFKESNRVRLQAENPAYPPIYGKNVRIEGRLIQVIRSY